MARKPIKSIETFDNVGKKRGFSPRCGYQPKINKLILLVFLVGEP
jgi:hypothetical protein